jgi:hypothetical protein
MRMVFQLAIALWVALVTLPASAVQVDSIYSVTVPTVTQSADEKNEAVQQGLIDVLIKVSGSAQVLDNPKVKARLQNANSLVQEFSYATGPESDTKTPYRLTLRYDADGINNLLQETGSAVWGANRPLIVGWIEVEGPNRPADIIDSDSVGNLPTVVKNAADKRGLALILPLMDVQDLNQVSTNTIANMTLPALETASKRYDSDAMLVGRIMQTDTTVNSQWRLQLGTEQWSWDIPGTTVDQVLKTVIDNVANTLATRYATVISTTVQTKLSLKVTGVTQQADLLQLMQYIKHLTPVLDVQLAEVAGNVVTLNVSLRGNKQAFTELLALSKLLQVQPAVAGAPALDDDTLAYKWTH